MNTYFLDLFSGIGGFALGAYNAGLRFDGHYFSEIDEYATRVYRLRFPGAVALGDINGIRGSGLPAGEWIIAGGFPCQDISVAGKGAGLAGARSGLWFQYARIIGELRPAYAIMENVGALAFRGLDSVLGSLAEIGYDAEWQDIRASDVGAPHRRERIWIVAYPAIVSCNARRTEPAGQFGKAGITESVDDVGYPCGGGRDWIARRRPGAQLADGHLQLETRALADSPSERLEKQGLQQGYNAREYAICDGQTESRGDWWATEPDVGRALDGFSAWLDRLDRRVLHEYNMTHGTTTKERPGETLRELRCSLRAHKDERAVGRSEVISPEEVLLAYLCKLEAFIDKKTDLFMESTEVSKGSLRSLRNNEELTSAPYRPESEKQSAGKHRDTLQALPRLLARDAEKAWISYRRENADSVQHWESGIARVAHGVSARVDRLKCLGNSIVPQIARLIFQQSAFDECRNRSN